MYIKNTKLSSVKFESKDIINVRSWNVNKTHGHANIFIRMLKIYDSSIVEPLSIIFYSCVNEIIFLDIWKKSNMCRFIKKVANKLQISIKDIRKINFQFFIWKYWRKQTTFSPSVWFPVKWFLCKLLMKNLTLWNSQCILRSV